MDIETAHPTEWPDLVALVRRLRAPGGCPWDRRQTHRSLRRYALEEAREVAGAIDGGDMHALAEELGDLLLQVLLHSVMAEERGDFGPGDVLAALADKLRRRHPHVFGDGDADGVEPSWEALKEAERAQAAQAAEGGAAAGARGLLEDVPRAQPALAEAQALGERAARVGFDWGDPAAAWGKVREEAAEFRAAWAQAATAGKGRAAGNTNAVEPSESVGLAGTGGAIEPVQSAETMELTASAAVLQGAGGSSPGGGDGSGWEAAEDELGDLLFAIVNVARLLDLDAEAALVATNDKFRRRFAAVERGARRRGCPLEALGLDEMEALWQAAKGHERGGNDE